MNVRVKTKILIAVVALAAAVGLTAWYKVYRDVPQPGWIAADPRDDFLYGWVGSRDTAAMPYWIWLALPRMFPEHLHGAGGYLSVGMSWEETREMPAGFAKKTLGYTRVAGNCALCHAASYRKGPDEGAVVVPAVPGHTTDLRGLFSFFRQCAQDPRFNADEILAEVDTATKLSLADRLLYRYLLIPRTRRALLKNDSMIVDSRLQRHGLDPSSEAPFSDERLRIVRTWLKGLEAPPYPLPIDATLAAAGKLLFAQHCGACHGADAPLEGIWLRGPYLHNGSVPTVRDLLSPQALRPRTFYRGNNLLDTRNVGFNSTLAQENGLHFLLYDTAQPGNGNSGHVYATELPDSEKDALLEYLKTL